jgi:hypothetical protein
MHAYRIPVVISHRRRLRRTGFGQESSFAHTIAQTFWRRFRSGTGHSIRNVEVLLFGHCCRWGGAAATSAMGRIAADDLTCQPTTAFSIGELTLPTLLGRPIAQYERPEPDLKQTLRSDPPQVVDSGSLLAASQRSAVSHKDLK